MAAQSWSVAGLRLDKKLVKLLPVSWSGGQLVFHTGWIHKWAANAKLGIHSGPSLVRTHCK